MVTSESLLSIIEGVTYPSMYGRWHTRGEGDRRGEDRGASETETGVSEIMHRDGEKNRTHTIICTKGPAMQGDRQEK